MHTYTKVEKKIITIVELVKRCGIHDRRVVQKRELFQKE